MRKIIARRRLLRGLAKREIRPEIAGKSSFGIGHNQGPPLDALNWIELQRIINLKEAGRLTNLSVDTLKRRYGEKILQLSPRRLGMRVRDALTIAEGID
jgi:hypothetical protein